MKSWLFCLLLVLPIQMFAAKENLPNIVVFIADDLGIGDLGCYGNKTIHTPNIDRLSKEGAKFSHHLAAGALCTPSRAAFMTGRHPIRMGMAGVEGTHDVMMYVSGKSGLPENETTWPKILQNLGYSTQAVGKWHLGWDDLWKGDQKHGPLGHGFDNFFGLPFTLVDGFEMDLSFLTYTSFYKSKDNPLHDHVVAFAVSLLTVFAVYSKNFGYTILFAIVFLFMVTWFFVEHFCLHTEHWWRRSLYMEKFLNSLLMRNTKIAEQPIKLETLTSKLTQESIRYLEDWNSRSGKSQPFLLYFAFPNVHTPHVPSRDFKGKSNHGAYGDSILEMDNAIGKVLSTLDEIGQRDDTLVLFASDHGCHIDLGPRGGSNFPFKGGKGMGAIEGGIRIPAIIRWPKKVEPGSVIEKPVSLLDFLPTIQEILGQSPDPELKIDGKSYLTSLLQTKQKTEKSPNQGKVERIFYHYCASSLHALRALMEDGQVFKAYFRRPKLNDQGHCGYSTLCPCFGPQVSQHIDSPILYDILTDPTEDNPIKPSDQRYKQVVPILKENFKTAEEEIYPRSQYQTFWDVLPRPWIQPCANFPICKTSG